MGNVPKIRFEGFTGEWERHSFGDDIISIQTGTNKLGSQEGKGMPLIKMGNIQRGYFSLDKMEYLSDFEEDEPENIAYYGDFFINTRNSLDLVGKGATWTGSSEKYAFNSNIARLRLRNIDTIFFNYLYNTPSMIKQVHSCAMGTTSVAAVYPQGLKSIRYYVPSAEEQGKIGVALFSLDRLILLYRLKRDTLERAKQYFLQNLFPRKGECVPRIRFDGFSDDWEGRALGELAQFNPKSKIPFEFEYIDLESVVGTEIVSQRKENRETAPSRAQRVARQGDLFFQTVRPYQRNNYLFEKPEENYVFSTGYAQLRPYVDGKYLLGLVQLEGFVKAVMENCTGTGYPAINSNDLAKITVLSTNNYSEQCKIGRFLRKFDALLSSYQKKCNNLSELKKYLLRNMFV